MRKPEATIWLKRAVVALLIAGACCTTGSGATYMASSTNPQTFGAAADFGVHVDMTPPASPMRGTVSVGATATETTGGTITNVAIQRSPAGAGTWTTICNDPTFAYSCPLDTSALANGEYDFRALATSSSGYTRASAVVVDRLVDNAAPTVTVTAPGAWFGGASVTLTSDANDNAGGSGVASVRYEYRTGTNAWATGCTGSTAPFSCTFNASSLTSGTAYEFRAVATDVAGNSATSASLTNRRADNTPPTATLTSPAATYLAGTVSGGGTAADGHSGIDEVRLQHKVLGGSIWTDACTDDTAPYSCSWDTTGLADDWYEVRLLAVDLVGNTFNTATGTWRRIDNTNPTVSLTDPGNGLSGIVPLDATASDVGGSNVASVRFQRSPAGADTWVDICTDTATPYSCAWDTASAVDGTYDLRAVAADGSGNTDISAVVASRSVDNPPSASDLQTTNGGTAGTVGAGDTIAFTYNEAMNPASIIAGWNGTGGRAVTVRFVNSGANDILTVQVGAAVLPLTSASGVTTGANFVGGPGATFNATLTYSGTTFTATIGSTVSGSAIAGGAGTMTWNPSAAATNPGGTPVGTTARPESGSPADVDF